ncbi:MAG: hypothetical protein JOZ58_09080, partial [Acetobacteraceae bacterium]|nr:hypothetical protein [Acetobacteraceae bacterium]
MANDIQDRVGQILGSDSARALAGTAVSEALKAFGGGRENGSGNGSGGEHAHRGLSSMRGLAAGAGAAAVAPLAAKGISKLVKGDGLGSIADAPKKLAESATSKLGDTVEGKLKEKVEDAGGPSGILKDTVKSALPFGGGDDDEDEGEEGKSGGKGGGATGFGQGRRIMVQQHQYVPVNIKDVYRAWTGSEWPEYMHRVKTLDRQIEEDSARYAIGVKGLWFNKNFTAEVQEQVPFKFITWNTRQGDIKNTGRVSFIEQGEGLTLMILNLDMSPSGLREKWVRGFRYHKRGIRGDFHRFAAWVQMRTQDELDELEGWLGTIEGGEITQTHEEYVEEHPEEQNRGEDSDEDEEDEEEPRGRNGGEPRQRRQSSRSRSSGQSSRGRQSSGSSSRAQSRSGSSSRSAGGSRSKPSSSDRSSRSSSSGSSRGKASSSSGKSSSRRSSSGRSSGGSTRGSSSKSTSGGSKSSGSSSKSSGSRAKASSSKSS